MNQNSRLTIWFPVIGAVLLVGGIWLGYLLAGGDRLSPSQKKLNTIFELISDEYVDEINPDSLIEMTIPGLMKNLDPHSLYIPLNELERVNRDLESSFFGVGVSFQIIDDSVCIVEVVSGGPAERVGIRAGDRIIKANGTQLTGKELNNELVFNTLRGPKDTTVDIEIKRESSDKLLNFTVTRGIIPSLSVDASYILEDNIGYIRISKFAANTYAEFFQAINSLSAKGATSYILDLRGNTGGLLDQAILIANEFLEPGRAIVNVRGRIETDNDNWVADGMGIFTDQPLVILMDEMSASSSEIVAGAIQDNDRGLIVGRRSFGKGLVQRQIVLPDSSQVRLTVQRYYTPSGRCIQKVFERGNNGNYESEIFDRYTNGEVFSADSIKIDKSKIFHTSAGRTVYGGGGILPDVFVPSDTTNITNYYLAANNAGLLNKFAYEYADLNRAELEKAKTVDELLAKLPPAGILLQAFVQYAADNGISPRWYYINISTPLIVNQLKALIARDILGIDAYFRVTNRIDKTVKEGINQIKSGAAEKIGAENSQTKK